MPRWLVLCLWSALAPVSAAQAVEAADLVLKHGRIYTVDAARSWAQALAVSRGKIVYVGADQGVQEFVGSHTRQVDLAERLVLPGFCDSHVHPVQAGVDLKQCDLAPAETVADLERLVRTCAATRPQASWIVGTGWALPLFAQGNPRREILDQWVSDRPALLYSADGHSAFANSKALAAAGIDGQSKDPLGGRIERDALTGLPSGTLRESAMNLVAHVAPAPTAAERRDALDRALRVLNGFGVVSFLDADADQPILDAYQAADRDGRLTAHVRVALTTNPEAGLSEVPHLIALRKQYQGRRLTSGSAKLYVDGVIEAKTAALNEPYLPAPGDQHPEIVTRGEPLYTAEHLNALVTALDAADFQVHMHAIGDRAIRMGLDAIEAAQKANGIRDARHQIAHLELMSPGDVPRFRRLGVIADFQPLWAYADSYIAQLTVPFLGPMRSRWLYPIRSVAASGAIVVAGSDWDASSANPLEAIQVATTRRGLSDESGPAFLPEEVVDLPTIIAAYTIGGAYARFAEKDEGSLEIGKSADFVVLDRNLFEIPFSQIHQAKVIWTVLEGGEVFRDPGWK